MHSGGGGGGDDGRLDCVRYAAATRRTICRRSIKRWTTSGAYAHNAHALANERVHSRVHTRAHRMKMDQENSGLKEQLATKKAENDREVTRAAVQ